MTQTLQVDPHRQDVSALFEEAYADNLAARWSRYTEVHPDTPTDTSTRMRILGVTAQQARGVKHWVKQRSRTYVDPRCPPADVIAAVFPRNTEPEVRRRLLRLLLRSACVPPPSDPLASPVRGDCWVIPTRANNYALVSLNGKFSTATRVLYSLNHKLPDGYVIDHLCRNRACVNPAHLEAVTIRENTLRGRKKEKYDGCRICGSTDGMRTEVRGTGKTYWTCRACKRNSTGSGRNYYRSIGYRKGIKRAILYAQAQGVSIDWAPLYADSEEEDVYARTSTPTRRNPMSDPKERRERIATAVLAALNTRGEISQLGYDPYKDAVYQADALIAELDKEPTDG